MIAIITEGNEKDCSFIIWQHFGNDKQRTGTHGTEDT